jgi:hypothetical protein
MAPSTDARRVVVLAVTRERHGERIAAGIRTDEALRGEDAVGRNAHVARPRRQLVVVQVDDVLA